MLNMKIKTGVISVLTNEVAEQTQRTQETWQQLAQSKKTIEAQKEIIRDMAKEVSFMKSQLVAWHLLLEAGIVNLPQEMFEEEDIFKGLNKNKKDKNLYNPDGSIKKHKLN